MVRKPGAMRAAAVTFSHFGGVALDSYDLDICSFRVLDTWIMHTTSVHSVGGARLM